LIAQKHVLLWGRAAAEQWALGNVASLQAHLTLGFVEAERLIHLAKRLQSRG